MPAPRLSLTQRIDSAYPELSKQEQRVADFILDHLGDVAVYNATELADRSGVSKATVSRLFRRLGFESAQEFRDYARRLRGQGVPIGARDAGADLAALLQAQAAQERHNLERVLATLGGGRLDAVVAAIAGAREVLVYGQRNGYPIALHLRQQLLQARDRVRLTPSPGQTMGEDLAGLGPDDVAVVLGFRRRTSAFRPLLQALTALEVPVVLIGDGSVRRYTEYAAHSVECPVDSVGALDSYGAAMSVVNLIAGAVLSHRQSEGRGRVIAISGLYDRLAELEEQW